jgi:predicted AlkP superfamily phosphohydrolase/phosphomutase
MYTPFGGIRVSLAGREPSGVVTPGGEYEALRDAILESLRPLRDAQGRPVIRNAWRREELFREGVAEQIPDVIFEVNPEFIPSNYFFDRPEVVTPLVVKSLTGVHAMEGIFLAAGPA